MRWRIENLEIRCFIHEFLGLIPFPVIPFPRARVLFMQVHSTCFLVPEATWEQCTRPFCVPPQAESCSNGSGERLEAVKLRPRKESADEAGELALIGAHVDNGAKIQSSQSQQGAFG